ncbi:helix-turn-helix domain-containing protein [Nocardioides albidus]|uniref:Helix-turn-helix domain-containing protein n=1 Tax=Nocardioides albidus TaxID=1517589 RepID=A0A5C4VNC3_9ACTN|nr:helix-turn-helix transcriptional regulator [Nocardioides albidus]TNM37394.1 helix-turn-helix domain-containing protein [Nocardioides albidus]
MTPTPLRLQAVDDVGHAPDRIVDRVLARQDRVAPSARATWRRLLALLADRRGDPASDQLCAVLANLVGIVAFGDAEDFAASAGLHDTLGERRLAVLQQRAARLLEQDAERRWSALACHRWLTADPSVPGASTCAAVAHAFVLTGIESVPEPATPLASVRELIEVATHGTVDEWRSHLSAVAASPWGADGDHLLRLARRSESPALHVAMEEVVTLCRELRRLHERTQVARHIRQCVARSGVSQREFATWVGTSPSRLSTYASGRVVPSATMLLRIRRASRALAQRAAGEISSPCGA